MKHLIPFLIIFFLLACSKNEEQLNKFLECSQIIEKYKLYNGENIECQFHFALTTYNQQKYIELFAHCADLSRPIVIDENCIDICEKLPYDKDSPCSKYHKSREIIKILLIEKQ